VAVTPSRSRWSTASFTDQQLAKLADPQSPDAHRYQAARELFDQVATGQEFVEFLTLPAYEQLDRNT
jgi:hypothetical protein